MGSGRSGPDAADKHEAKFGLVLAVMQVGEHSLYLPVSFETVLAFTCLEVGIGVSSRGEYGRYNPGSLFCGFWGAREALCFAD